MSFILALLLFIPTILCSASFELTPEQLLKRAAANKQDPDKSIVLLEENTRMRFDAMGRCELTFHRIYFIRTAEAVEDWDTVSTSFTPWYQAKPTIRARVVTKDGRQHELDQKTLVDSPALEYEADIYSDRRTVSAPLPAVAAGSIVEWEYVLKDTAPFFPAGSIHSWHIGEWMPVERVTLELIAPASIDLKVSPKRLPEGAIRRTEAGGSVTWRLDLSPGPKVSQRLPMTPSTEVSRPVVGISTGRTWNHVAAEYSRIVDERIAGAKLSELGLTVSGKLSREATIDSLLRKIHQQVRYIGIELGDGSIYPRTPAETMTRHYGDCKDKAALLVAALRNAGIPAYVALLNAGAGSDVDNELPGLGSFNHAIAYVPGENPLWIDATDENSRLGVIPLGDQGRLALIASSASQSLTKIPVTNLQSNWYRYSRDIIMSDDGPAKVTETITAGGSQESELRAVYAGDQSREMRDAIKNYAKNTLLADEQKLLSNPARHDFTSPFELKWETPASKRFIVDRSTGAAAIMPAPLLENLPYWFKAKSEAEDTLKDADTLEWEKRNKERTLPFELNHPHSTELHYLITPPPFFKAKSLPRSGVETMGPARLEKKFSITPEGRIEAKLRFEMPGALLTPAEAITLRDKARQFIESGPILIEFILKADESLALGKVREALVELKQAVAANPDRAIHRSRLARGYLQAGLGRLARIEAAKATDLDPKSAQAFHDLAFVLQHDLVGRHFRSGWDADGAIAALEKSLSIKESPVARADLAITYEHDSEGYRYSGNSRMEKAVAEYVKLGDKLKESGVEQNFAITLMMLGRWEEMESAAKKLSNVGFAKLLTYVARASIDGAPATIISIQRDFAEANTRSQVLVSVGASLIQSRNYELAAEFFRAAARITPNANIASRLETVAKARRAEDLVLDPADPATPIKAFMRILFSPKFTFASLRPYVYDTQSFDREVKEAMDAGKSPEQALRVILNGVMNQVRGQGITPDVMGELMSGSAEYLKTGDEDIGYRIEIKMRDAGELGKFYVLKQDGRYVAGANSSDFAEILVIIPRLLKEGKLKMAQAWMDWIVQDQIPTDGTDELSLPPVRYLWSGVNAESRGTDAILVALASMKGPKSVNNADRIATLQAALLKAKIPRDRAHLLLAIAQRQQESKLWSDLLATSRKLVLAAPKSGVAFELLIRALVENKLLAEAQTAADLRLKATAKAIRTNVELEDEKALEAMALIAMSKKDWKGAVSFYDRLAKQRNFNETIKANALWVRCLAQMLEAPPFEMAEDEQNKIMDAKQIPTALPRAMHFALQGKPAEARERLIRFMEVSGQYLDSPSVNAVMARICESLGEKDEAALFWKSVVLPKTGEPSFADLIALKMI